jgi:hypothetical protein
MALNDQQKQLAKDLAVLVGTTLHLVPDQADVQDYLKLIASEIDTVASATISTNPVKDEVEASLAVLKDIETLIPDTTAGKKKFGAAISFLTGIAHMFGL